MNKVKITPNKTTGKLVNAYEGNPKFGYIQLRQSKKKFIGGWLRDQGRSTIMKGETAALEEFVRETPTLELEGSLYIKEYVESQVPEALASQHFDSSKEYEDQIKGYIKTAGEGGPALMSNGERIIKFTVWDESGTDSDILVQHENVEEIKAYNLMQKESGAELPK